MATRRSRSARQAFTPGSAPSALDFAGLDQLLGYHLRRAQGAVHRDYLSILGALKLTQKQTAVMWLVQGNPGVAQGAVGTALDMDRATMMALVDRLEARGLLRRVRSRVDARRRELHATPAGVQLLGSVRDRIDQHETRIKRQFNAAELRALQRLLRRLHALESQALR